MSGNDGGSPLTGVATDVEEGEGNPPIPPLLKQREQRGSPPAGNLK